MDRQEYEMNGYRKELKFIVGDDILLDTENRIGTFMRRDEHQNGKFYRVRSVYFDSMAYTCYRENLAGISTREKYRIRTYNCNDSVITAEVKIRHADTISKMSTPIDKEYFEMLIQPDPVIRRQAVVCAVKENQGNRVLEKYLNKILNESYSPAVIVDYERSAFVYDTCNVRITFDRNTFASREFDRIFDNTLTGRPAIEDGRHILEIKYDEFLPDEIKDALGGLRLNRDSSSKYAKCMKIFENCTL